MPSPLAGIARFPRVRLGHAPTPIDPAPNLGAALGVDLRIKRDDCTGLAFGGNKVRQLEFHFGEARARGADTVLVTGAVQSNLVRIAAAAARKLGMAVHIQLEDRVAEVCTSDGRTLSVVPAHIVPGPGPETEPALTASFEGLPEAHDGEEGFHFRVAFSEEIGIGFRSMRDDSFTVSGGEVTGVRRVDRRHDLWRITVEPDGEGDVTVTLAAGRECAVSGAICTRGGDRRQLTNTATATVAGPVDEDAPAVLTASFVQAPAEHDGSSPFKLRIAFSEGISIGFRTFRDQSLSVSGGSVKNAKRVDRRKDLWEVTVKPGSLGEPTATSRSIPIPQRTAPIESLAMAFEVAKAMQADGLEWSEGYRPLGARRSPRSSRAGSEALDYWLDSLDGSAMRD